MGKIPINTPRDRDGSFNPLIVQKRKTEWLKIFDELKNRGLEDVLFISMDGLRGLEEAASKCFLYNFSTFGAGHTILYIV